MKKTKLQRHSLVLGIILTLIGIASAWGIAEMAYSSYEYIPADYYGDKILTDDDPELFGPRRFNEFDWEFHDRFNFDSDKDTTNC
jgi:hypothetical protein